MSRRLEVLLDIETTAQQRWEQEHRFETNATTTTTTTTATSSSSSTTSTKRTKKCYVTTALLSAHQPLLFADSLTLCKADFTARYWRLKGRPVLWPVGFHVSGSSVSRCAQNIQEEVDTYGSPPQFPEDEEQEKHDAPLVMKMKCVYTRRRQWNAMKTDFGGSIPEDEIPRFADPQHWLDHFPRRAAEELKRLGCHIDFRRSFISTDANPFYNSFVEWQFRKLEQAGKLKHGKRLSIVSPKDGRMCSDQDRACGEGVVPLEYTLVKMLVQNASAQEVFKSKFLPDGPLVGKEVLFPCATLHPHTIIGLGNCWVDPNVTYGAFEVQPLEVCPLRNEVATGDGDDQHEASTPQQIFIMTINAARNLSFQHFKVNGVTDSTNPEPLFEVAGKDLIGLPLCVPSSLSSSASVVYALPLPFNISTTSSGSSKETLKATGIQVSVPSFSPQDYMNVEALRNNSTCRDTFGVKEEWILPAVDAMCTSVVDIPVGGEHSRGCGSVAEAACKKFKVKGIKDAGALAEATKFVCQQLPSAAAECTTPATMASGPFQGQPIAHAKLETRKRILLEEQQGAFLLYNVPEHSVVSRSGDECVVSYREQWYIEYGEEEWKRIVLDHVKNNMADRTPAPAVLHCVEEAVEWLREWPCTRTFGLGTFFPADASITKLIDALSDSTLHTAYATIAHFFHVDPCCEKNDHATSMNFDGHLPNKHNIKSESLDEPFWDYVMLGDGCPETLSVTTGIDLKVLVSMRREMQFWYPVDVHLCGKHMIHMHVAMFLYQHAAIFHMQHQQDGSGCSKDITSSSSSTADVWPRSVVSHGTLRIDNQKMCMTTPKPHTLREAIEKYGADCTRLALADAGDSMDDANFVSSIAGEFILKLTSLIEQAKEIKAHVRTMRQQSPAGKRNEDGTPMLCDGTSSAPSSLEFFDQLFENALNVAIIKTDQHLETMNFRKALTTGYFELIAAHSQYKIACGGVDGMNSALAMRFMESFVKMLMPFAPHVSEYIWNDVLGNSGDVDTITFPEPSAPVDFGLARASQLVQETCTTIRAQTSKLMKKQRKRNDATSCEVQVQIHVASVYLKWQRDCLNALRTVYEDNQHEFPPNLKQELLARNESWLTMTTTPNSNEKKESAEATVVVMEKKMSKSKRIQQVMQFIDFARMNCEKYGPDAAFSLTPACDDMRVLQHATEFIVRTTNVRQVQLCPYQRGGVDSSQEARPGEPIIIVVSQ